MAQRILVVDDKQVMRDSVAAILQRAGFLVVTAPEGATALKMRKKHRPTAVLTDLSMPNMTGLELLDELLAAQPGLPVVLMTAFGGVNDAVSAMKAGAFDFIQKPFEGDALLSVMKRAVAAAEAAGPPAAAAPRTAADPAAKAPRSAAPRDPLAGIVGDSPAMRRVKAELVPVAAADATVLIRGESGTGKEVVARACHAASRRRDAVMLCLNCAALSSSLLESELFGHERGAFTGADSERKGRFELADGGTLFLDEVSEIDPTLQAKLLRVLQEGQFERVGSSATRSVDVRVIATTNRDLTRSVADGSFRQDLYYRLNVLPLELPPLRDRGGDVPALAAHFLRSIAQRSGAEPKRLTPEAEALLSAYRWPGNVRELQNLCERAAVLGGDGTLGASLFRPWLEAPPGDPAAPPRPAAATAAAAAAGALTPAAALGSPSLQPPSPNPDRLMSLPPVAEPVVVECEADPCEGSGPAAVRPLDEIEREKILAALAHFDGNRTRAASALGIGLRTLGVKLKKWKEEKLVPAEV
ncbi:sigma-54-dependent transcriptional regulator [Phycisphaera mikurensis]|uniref:NtrC family two-component system response regulator n=1 Tax=Phycisphaera mikurensis (strain NBRC 102666 / KCTC 22515 / FYK2301M01) TaxID=1142394 RepID=I0IGE9_PHYMF|nr:sigma-54 dependent transcriptional regulator [Phycisphaera mikurensis]MBB6440285.1 DNA-binding NtrC family response regulator [Phycisphaera mikurensis]BAM04337.1 NtrC family two-component system response regulator [Phycisphaera mikurensis NBRC 102666]